MRNQITRASGRVIVRTRIADWLHDNADVAVRLIVAPPGFGKTTALAAYAESPTQRRRITLSLDERTTSAALGASIATALGVAGPVTAAAISALPASAAPLEVVLDNLHVAAEDLLTTLNELLVDLPPNIFFILASQ